MAITTLVLVVCIFIGILNIVFGYCYMKNKVQHGVVVVSEKGKAKYNQSIVQNESDVEFSYLLLKP